VTCARIDESGPPRVAYAVSRRVGGAVARNRIRRRLRAVVRAEAAFLEPACAYLIGAGPGALKTPFSELRATFRAIVGDLAAQAGAAS
jgi:ribonuclease P protein component